jgi:hypothetical protein
MKKTYKGEIKMMIPTITKCEFFLYHKEENYQIWLCLLELKGHEEKYHIYLGIRDGTWIQGSLFKGHDFKHQSGVEASDVSFSIPHLFEQLVQTIQSHSKDRLRLVTYRDREYGYGNEDFQPLSSYDLPKKVKMNEKTVL